MSSLTSLGFRGRRLDRPDDGRTEYLMFQRPLQRVLAFRGRSIDDVVNDPVVKNEILGFWKLHKQVQRSCEVTELERQWNRRPAGA